MTPPSRGEAESGAVSAHQAVAVKKPQKETVDEKILAEMLKRRPADLALQTVAAATSDEDRREVQQRLRDLKQIPALKSLARKFSQSLGMQTLEISEVIAAIGHDPALCMRVMSLANSTSEGSRMAVEDLSEAVQRLGVARVRLIANTLLLQRDGESIASGFDWKHLWMHSLATAILAEKLDKWISYRAGPVLPLCAILHDVGKIALSVVVPDLYREIMITAWQAKTALPELEKSRLGIDHREAGWTFGSEAALPPVVLDAIAFHDEPMRAQPEHRATVALVGVANQWAKLYGLGFSGDGSAAAIDLWETPAWARWQATLPVELDVDDFVKREAKWIEDVRRDLKAFYD
jgi:HD-like signal output (HDOD) protein